MSCCIIKGCANAIRSKKYVNSSFTLHRFPQNEEVRKQWISACRMEGKNVKNRRVCNLHFQEQDFILKNRKRILTTSAVPSVGVAGNLPKEDYHVKLPLNNLTGKNFCLMYFFMVSLGNGQHIKISFDHNQETSLFPKILKAEAIQNSIPKSKISQNDNLNSANNLEIVSLKKRVQLLKNTITSCRNAKSKKNSLLKIQFAETNKRILAYKHTIKSLTNDLKNLASQIKKKMKEIRKTSTECFAKIFSPAQLNILKNKQKKAMWSVSDIAKAIALRAKSPRAYNYLRKVWRIPLPAKSTLLKYTQKIDFVPGVLKSVMNLLRHEFQDYSDMKREAVLSFDEMSVDSDFCYDFKHDKIEGGDSNITLAIIRGLFYQWKQPVFFNFSQITAEEIYEIIVKCHKVGINVRAMVCDLGGKNRGLWNGLDVSISKPYIFHPKTGERIWVFADAPHLIKLLRNHILDQGLTLSSKRCIKKEDFSKLLRLEDSDFRMQYKLSDYHLNLRGRERQRVLPACQLLSNRTYEALTQAFPDRKSDWLFIKQVNDWFDIMNSRNHNEKNPFKSGYAVHLKEQNRKLNAMFVEISHSRCCGKDHLDPFQKGILMSIKSLQGLLKDLKSTEMPVTYILTHRLNQDVLENAFSVIRSIGSYNDSPTAEDVKNRLKILMLGWNFGKTKSACVETDEPKIPFISYKLLSTLVSKDNVSNDLEDDGCFENKTFDDLDEEDINQSNWAERVDGMALKEKCEFFGLEYVSGFIAHKLKKKFPELKLTQNANRQPESFTESISRGFLSIPSYNLLNNVRKFEKVFLYMFRDCGDEYGIYRGFNCMKSLTKQLLKLFPEMPEKLIKLYVKTRIFIRIKRVNQIMKLRKFKKGKKKSKIHHWLRSSVPKPSPSSILHRTNNSNTEGVQNVADSVVDPNVDVFSKDDGFFEQMFLEFDRMEVDS